MIGRDCTIGLEAGRRLIGKGSVQCFPQDQAAGQATKKPPSAPDDQPGRQMVAKNIKL